MIRSDFHMHTTYCDGKASVEEMVLSAIEKGFVAIGISGHGYTPFDESYCMSQTDTESYVSDVLACKEKYKDKIKVYLGIEVDYFAGKPTIDADYVIGSVHYLSPREGVYIPIDESPEKLCSAIDLYFGGDVYAAAEAYFRCVGDVVKKTGADIIGHFDLITKFTERGFDIDEAHPRYVCAYTDAVDRLLSHGVPFEINTGAMARGYKKAPYPAPAIIKYIAEHGGNFIFTSDSHTKENIGHAFPSVCETLAPLGLSVLRKPPMKSR